MCETTTSLQVLTECKQSAPFSALLKRLESKPACRGRSLEAFLTYPMHQVPRYIITLHELLAHTPHDHVERKSLQSARQQLEDLSRQMHDEVSETENLRKNLALERMIVQGCDILLDCLYGRGSLIHVPSEKPKASKNKLPFKTEKEAVRQCFLFSNHLIIATRTSSGKLNLVPDVGKIPLADALLIEDPSEHPEDDVTSVCSASSQSTTSETSGTTGFHNRDFKIIVDIKSVMQPTQLSVHLVAQTMQEKAAWVSDIIQCLDNVQFNDMMRPTMADSSSISLPQSLKNDPKLFKDEADIRFSRTLNSCKVPQIRYATPERLLERLTDLRFLSIDFLNTFLLTYRVFTDGVTVLDALKKVFYSIDSEPQGSVTSLEGLQNKDENTFTITRRQTSQRTSGASSVSGYGSEMSDRDRSHSYDSQGQRQWKATLQKYEEECNSSECACSPSNLSSVTLVESPSSDNGVQDAPHLSLKSPTKTSVKMSPTKDQYQSSVKSPEGQKRPSVVLRQDTIDRKKCVQRGTSVESDHSEEHPYVQTHRASCSSSRSASISTSSIGVLQVSINQNYAFSRKSTHDGDSTARSSFQHESPQKPSKAGVVITSFRKSKRRSSTSTAAAAFAIATCGSSNPRDISPGRDAQEEYQAERNRHKESVMSTACTMRVLNVLRHWISKHPQDFENDQRLKTLAVEFLDDIIYSPNLLPAEHKAAAQLLRLLMKEDTDVSRVDLRKLLQPPLIQTTETIESLSALEVAEQMTFIDHHIFIEISSDQFLGQAWMKSDKDKKAPHIIMMTKRFNDMSRLVASEILRRDSILSRVNAIEKWSAVADICRCLHNFNGVYRFALRSLTLPYFDSKKTWEKVSKTSKQNIEKLQNIVSSDGRFRSLRDALHRCDPPCIPYLGLYLTDLSFIEEGTPNFTSDGLLNFAKMRMVAHVIREIRHFQQTPYKIQYLPKVAHFLLDTSMILDDDALYNTSLKLEPRTSRLVSQSSTTTLK
ncbi:hypothetical protein NQ317_013830 [Molorchus minor]|uniref:Ras-specific guanine nucleotide-releasing factor 1 n=1 Tax=Molorchus minor TaxID=1323400 RepID=A0ABQ9IYS6_9CUCU|nr:hypothetical protein NQ317_013830 [Molorchus minor]